MSRRFKFPGMGLQIALGFMIVLGLMATLGAVGLRHVADANHRLKSIGENNNLKTELASVMQNTLRERALSIQALAILSDPFERDAEIARFNAQGNRYNATREQLEKLATNDEERIILARILGLTKAAHPEIQAVVEASVFTDNQGEVFRRVVSSAMPRQREIAEQVNALVELQREQTRRAVSEAETSYRQVRTLMLLLGAVALATGGLVAWFVSRQAARQAQLLVTQAHYDPLTGLPNRALLHRQLEHEMALAKRDNTSLGLVLLDLDRFKEVNDTLGHAVGDEVLREVAMRLKKTIRAADTVARLGGDEYVVLLHDADADHVSTIAKKMLAALDRPFQWEDQAIDLGGSMGIAFFPSQCSDASSLLRCADIAMYVAKRSARGFVVYAPEHDQTDRSELSLKSELREAIQSDQLTLHFQPQVDHRSRCIRGIEALVRWNHPHRGFLGPESFILLAEEAGLIVPLTSWVLRSALVAQRRLCLLGHDLNVAVNLSARNLQDNDLPATVRDLLDEIGVRPERLTLEITESAVMDDTGNALAILTRLDQMGVGIAIDDFGTGYSSLAYLKGLPVDELKIDKSFVMEMETNDNDAVIVRSIIDLAHNLGLKVIAEGVETQDSWDLLDVLGCDASQGYLIARPLPAELLAQWLQEYAGEDTAPPRHVA